MNKNSRGGNYLAPLCLALVVAAMGAAEMAADEPGQTSNFVFRDATESAGLMPQVGQIQGHAAGWGDIDGDGHIDLYVATFAREEGKRNLLFRNQGGRFTWDEQSEPQIATRATGAVLADLDNDGDLDLYVSSMPQPKSGALGCSLFHNDGTGQFANISHGNGACPTEFGGRSAAVLDFDGDGLLDLLVGEDPLPGYNGSKTKSSRLFRNLGGLAFEDASAAAGLPAETPGLGVAAADINNDGWPDLFLASHAGGNVLLLNDGSGRFKEAAGCRETFAWPEAGGDNMVCGVCFGDINRDGLLDVALGPHFKAPWQEPVAIRLYINRGVTAGQPRFEEIGQQAGLLPLAMKTPHVELQDYDNDGWPDLSTTMIKFADGQAYPVIYRHLGLMEEMPKFATDVLARNDFPTPADVAMRRSGPFFEKMLADKKVIYTAPGPSGDYDNDGRLDMFLPSWWEERPSLLLRNETPGGHWLDVRIEGSGNVNRMGIGTRINVYSAGKLGQAAALLGSREIAVGYGYASAQPAIAHFGLGDHEAVDVEIVFPHGIGSTTRENVAADQPLLVERKP